MTVDGEAAYIASAASAFHHPRAAPWI